MNLKVVEINEALFDKIEAKLKFSKDPPESKPYNIHRQSKFMSERVYLFRI